VARGILKSQWLRLPKEKPRNTLRASSLKSWPWLRYERSWLSLSGGISTAWKRITIAKHSPEGALERSLERNRMENTIGTPKVGGTITPEYETSKKETLQQKAHEARERLTEKASEAKERVQTEGENVLRGQKNRLAEQISHYGNAVHRAADQLDEEKDAAIAYYTHQAAEQLDRAADYLRDRNWSDLKRDAEGFARRHQGLVFGGLLLAGIALARMLKASQHDDVPQGGAVPSTEPERPYGQGDWTAPQYQSPATTSPLGTNLPTSHGI
jgi:hypothetical protein